LRVLKLEAGPKRHKICEKEKGWGGPLGLVAGEKKKGGGGMFTRGSP